MTKLASILILTIAFAVTSPAQTSLKVGAAAPVFSGTLLDGKPVDLNELKGNVVVMTFWSTRCAICHHELPKLNRVVERADAGKVVFLALSMENEEKISGYVKNNPFRSQIIANSFGTVLKYADRDKAGNLDMGFPAFFVIDQDGLIRYRSSGYDKTSSLDAAINKLVSK